MFETFDHTADLGLRVWASTLPELFEEAGRGLCSLMVENLEDVKPAQSFRFEIPKTATESETEYLLFDWLNELLYFTETEHVLFSKFAVTFTENGLSADVRGEPMDTERHRLCHEVKAITYHLFSITESETGWRAELIVDI